MKVSLEAKELKPVSGRRNLASCLVFTGPRWNSIDLCVHGQQLRWHCAECEQYFTARQKPKQKKRE